MKVLVAVDFGTTFSAICWALTEKPQETNLVQQWPGDAGGAYSVPSTLLYDDQDGSHSWGYEIKGNEPRHEWFKLGLHPQAAYSELARKYPSTTALPKHWAEDEALVVEYLTDLRKHAETTMEDTYGRTVFSKMAREYIITVPAVWSESAQHKTRACARNAGMGDSVQIITEPEAAGIYALSNMPTLNLKPNDTFVLCDAGGGTVDLVSYTIRSLTPIPVLYETARGSGDLCGSIFLNRIFSAHLREKFENFPAWDEDYHADALKVFENDLKRNFTNKSGEKYMVPARGLNNPELGIKGNKLHLSGKEIKNVFEPVIDKVIVLVQDQIVATPKPVKAVLMAGGFGNSKYLKERIQMAISAMPGNIEVWKVASGDTAIVRGALLRGLSEKEPGNATIRVESRVARRHYGTCAHVPFDPKEHDENRKVPGPFGADRVETMHWIINKNTNIPDSAPVVQTVGFWWDLKVIDGPPNYITMCIYACDKETPSKYLDKNVHELVKIDADVRHLPADNFKKRGLGNEWHYEIPYSLEMTVHSGSIKFALIVQGKRYEANKVEFK